MPGNCSAGGVHAQLHVTPTGGGIVANTWGWSADHDLKEFNGSKGRTGQPGPWTCEQPSCCVHTQFGLVNEGTSPMLWLGTAFEHHTAGGYVLRGAANQLFLMTQTEQPYWAPLDTQSQALTITDSRDVSIYGGFYGAGGFFTSKPANNDIGILTQNTVQKTLILSHFDTENDVTKTGPGQTEES